MSRRTAALAFISLAAALLRAADPYQEQREKMVREQIEARGVHHRKVLLAMRAVPRHLFVPDELAPYAYNDTALRIDHGQTISQPYIVALMTDLLEPRHSDRVLEVGTGSGYQAAVLARLVQFVYSIEIVQPLGEEAAQRLAKLGVRNVEVRIGNGYAGWPEHAPFDRIILTAAPPEIPQALIGQLKPGGKMVAPVGEGFFNQSLVVLDKSSDGKITRRRTARVTFVPMVDKPQSLAH
jgi:protein-L-isoaspartate(D-aspartate) O-methyltransferase